MGTDTSALHCIPACLRLSEHTPEITCQALDGHSIVTTVPKADSNVAEQGR